MSKAPMNLKEQLHALVQVQELDLKIDQLKTQKSNLPLELKALDDSTRKLSLTAESKKAAMVEMEKANRQSTAAQELNQDRIQRAEAKIAASVTSPRDLQAAQREMDQLKKVSETLNTQKAKTQLDFESAKKAFEGVQAEIDKIKDQRASQEAEISARENKIDGNLAELMNARKGAIDGIGAPLLTWYDRVRGARAGIGIAPAVSGSCRGCNRMVPPQMYNELQKYKEQISCPTCHRILYVPSAPKA